MNLNFIRVFCLFILLVSCLPSTGIANSYVAASQREYEQIRDCAFGCLETLSGALADLGKDVDQILEYYNDLNAKAYDQLGQVTIGSFELQRAFLAFKKLAKACENDNLDLVGPKPVANGRHNETSQILGIRSNTMTAYKAFVRDHSEFVRFGNSLYFNNPNCPGVSGGTGSPSTSMTMLPAAMQVQSDRLGLAALNSYLSAQNLNLATVYAESDFRSGVTYIYDSDNE